MSIDDACKNALKVIENKQLNSVYLAYSGGLDSTALLHAFGALLVGKNVKLTVLHANHGLQKRSDEWQLHCEKICQQLGFEMRSIKLDIGDELLVRKGPEAAAREARYQWFMAEISGAHAALATAHHQDDQAETVLLNLMRGSGIAGLAGISGHSVRNGVTLLRPFLPVSKAVIEKYAQAHNLKWIEDPSNRSPEFLRNRVRHELLPLLEEARNGTQANLIRLADNMRETQELLEEVAREDQAINHLSPNPLDGSYCLPVAGVKKLSQARVINVVRYWLKSVGLQSPPRSALLEIARWCRGELSQQFSYHVADACFYGYRGELYYVPDGEQKWLKQGEWLDSSRPWLMGGGRQLRAHVENSTLNQAPKLEIAGLSREDECDYRHRKARALGKLVQDHRMPVWRRNKLWGVKSGSEILWVAGLPKLESGYEFFLEYSQ
ncbi:MAG: tRNA lysidine(34) synthetase TilS [Proteobacteria bacterium]|jgi:tRNA(Ile)-lysidine synthase|nr:tRNA lysidine(34) synthetase TilS [Pseudomonadota bacterium]